ncbi:Phosphoribosylformylglycinamidine synthase [Cladobotryum mycophilum]|uniref:phosphoribosylformylglycinamidine synthase n=1 Tax=Cladobotryum mycophilum TaxID=491253 RepID=A0ABR0SB78_9HYPO
MPPVSLVGSSCYTASDAQKLRDLINKTSSSKVKDIRGQWVYYIDLNSPAPEILDKVQGLLQDVGSEGPASSESTGTAATIYVTPRYISPWSSKATSIAHVCGLRESVLRIERGRRISIEFEEALNAGEESTFRDALFDRMTEIFAFDQPSMEQMFETKSPSPLVAVDIFADKEDPLRILREYNLKMGLSLDESEMQYLVDVFTKLGRPPHDVELFMFAQVNSEHCRHKVFNSAWTIDGIPQDKSLFEMIKTTHKATPDFTISAYSDNAAVIEGEEANVWAPDYSTGSWKLIPEVVHILTKVETHNHPTAISPFPGAATGSGGEIRDEAAVGRGSTTKAGLSGFWVSDLLIPDQHAPWEVDIGRPRHYASSLDIMLEAPIGSARFNNEFGRPALAGVFRTLLTPGDAQEDADPTAVGDWRGYHKPIMIAGGLGTVRPQHALKEERFVREGAHVIVLGGPAMLIGLGGGAASSNASGEGNADLDFDSVQRGNPEMERRAQMVINTCTALGEQNPIAMIHDVGAGGLSNALPELVKDAGFGGKFELRQVESMDRSMSPLEIWCNESQERYVLLINTDGMNRFTSICRRERCGFSDVGTVVAKNEDGATRLTLTDRESKEYPSPIDLPMDALFPPKRLLKRDVASKKPSLLPFNATTSLRKAYGDEISGGELFKKAVERVFLMPAVGSKSFLITIGDRSVGGLTVRDQMVGPWQTPVADVAVTATSFHLSGKQRTGEAMAMGEKPTLALIDPAASARMAIAESLLNIGAADIKGDLRHVKLSANWMAAVNHPGEGAALYEAVKAAMEMCTSLKVSIPVGKDSTSMKASWKDGEHAKSVTAPVSVVISAFSVVEDIRSTWTPQLRRVEDVGETVLMFVDLAEGRKALGGSALAQSLGSIGNEAPDMKNFDLITDYFDALSQLHKSGVVLAYHDRSDGGLITTVAEMAFAGRVGVDLMIDGISKSGDAADIIDALFNEEVGAVFQVRASDEINFKRCFATCGPPPGLIRKFGVVKSKSRQTLTIRHGGATFATLDRAEIQQWWSKTSFEMQRLRDNSACAESEYSTIADSEDPGISYKLSFSLSEKILPLSSSITGFFGKTPRVAILREQGVNGHAELAFAFKAAGFEPIDVHMTDVLDGRSLADFTGLAAPGGFSYGDVLGAGQGWAKSILMHENTRREFVEFFKRPDTFALGVCNGCQMLTRIKELIPGAQDWPNFVDNISQQFEARYSMVKVQVDESRPSVFFHGMNGSSLPIVVSHGEGRAKFPSPNSLQTLAEADMIPLRYVDNRRNVTEQYPFNPNGSPAGVAGVSSKDGRVVAMMPHPERTILAEVASYVALEELEEWGEYGPWVRMFRSARRWVG